MRDALGERIADQQLPRQVLGQPLDHPHLGRQPPVAQHRRERARFRQQPLAPRGKVADHAEQRRRRPVAPENVDIEAGGVQHVVGDIHPAHVAEVLPAILQVIDDLQRGAERIRRRPDGAVLAVDVADEAPDRHRRFFAIGDQVGIGRRARGRHVAGEGGEQVGRVGRIEAAGGEDFAQRCGRDIGLAVSGECRGHVA